MESAARCLVFLPLACLVSVQTGGDTTSVPQLWRCSDAWQEQTCVGMHGERLAINGQSCFTSVWVSWQAGCSCDPPAPLPVPSRFPTPSRAAVPVGARGCSHPSCG